MLYVLYFDLNKLIILTVNLCYTESDQNLLTFFSCTINMSAGQNNECCSLRGAFLSVMKVIGVICLLYIFICTLDLLSSAFRLLGGKTAGEKKT